MRAFFGAILLAILTIAGMLFGLLAMPFFVLREWTAAIQLLGLRAALRAGRRKGMLRFRQPIRDVLFSAPGCSSITPLVLLTLLLHAISAGPELVRMIVAAIALGLSAAFWRRSPNPTLPLLLSALGVAIYVLGDVAVTRTAVALAVASGMVAVLQPLLTLVPPVVLFLGSSDYAQFQIMKRLQKLGPFQVLSLIDQSSPGVVQQYVSHYGGLGPDPTAPRVDSLRTRTKWWKRTVRELMETAPILVIDTRTASPAVVREARWALSPSHYLKTLFLVGEAGVAPALDDVLPPGTNRDVLEGQTVTEQKLYPRILELTRSRDSLSTLGGSPSLALERLFDEVAAQERALQALRRLLFSEGVANRDINQAFAAFHAGAVSAPAAANPPPAVSTGLERALALARRRFPFCTISVHIHHTDLAKVEIGLWDRSGNVRVFVSQDDMEPPKAVLHAMLEAELDEL